MVASENKESACVIGGEEQYSRIEGLRAMYFGEE
jgi:hypothetical protein